MTSIENKAKILHDLYIDYSTDSEFEDFVAVHDLGIPLAVLIVQGHATATPSGLKWIESDYNDLCEEIGVDKYGDYDSLEDMFMLEGPDEQG
jgi:hypothetical protein